MWVNASVRHRRPLNQAPGCKRVMILALMMKTT
jgi:hypothetical protein